MNANTNHTYYNKHKNSVPIIGHRSNNKAPKLLGTKLRKPFYDCQRSWHKKKETKEIEKCEKLPRQPFGGRQT